MLRDEKILNRKLRNTIDTLKDDIQNKSKRIKEYARQALNKDQQALKPPEIQLTQALKHPEIQLTQEATPSFDSQLEAYVKAKRGKYEEHLVNRKDEEMHSLKKTQQKPDQAKIQKRNKRFKRNKVNPVKVNNEQATHEKFSLVSQIQKVDNKEQNKHATANMHAPAPADTDTEKKTSSFTWKKGTVLITGDSMLNGIDESKMRRKSKAFLRSYYRRYALLLKTPLKKGPTAVFLHIGTNDATENGIDSDLLVKRILHFKEEIEKSVDGCKVILSLPIRRRDNIKANNILLEVCDKIRSLKLDTINNNNIMHEQLGRRGLHLNQHGSARFALNLINKLRYA